MKGDGEGGLSFIDGKQRRKEGSINMVWRSIYNDLDRCISYYVVKLRFIAENNCRHQAILENLLID